MKITKYEHSCIVVEEQGKSLVIDPGVFSKSFAVPERVQAVIITHVHPDHFDAIKLRAIYDKNPDAAFFSVGPVAQELPDLNIRVVEAGQSLTIDTFDVSFYGGQHAIIHASYPEQPNVGVLVNKTFFYPGDSFCQPDTAVKVLAVPASGPWMKIGDAMDYIHMIKAETVFPAHNILLSEIGAEIHYRMLKGSAEAAGSAWTVVEPGSNLEIS